MRGLGRALALSAALWLAVTVSPTSTEDLQQDHRRHIDMHGILDPAGMVGQLGESLTNAGRVLGLRIADTVADLVSSAFSHRLPAAPPRQTWTRGDPGVVSGPSSGPGGGGAMGEGLGGFPQQGHYGYPTPHRAPHPDQQPSVLGGILRLLGLDSSKLGAIALNGVIFLAQLISSSLIGRPGTPAQGRHRSDDAHSNASSGQADSAASDEDDDEEEPTGSPLSWILDNPALKGSSALRTAQDPDLAERIIQEIQERFPRPGGRRSRAAGRGAVRGGDTSCIQLLVCKAGPFLRGMQRSLHPVLRAPAPSPPGEPHPKGDPGGAGAKGAGREQEQWSRLSPVQRMFAHMPTADEVLQHASVCAQRFPNCKVAH